jgi:serine/threonine protein kinase
MGPSYYKSLDVKTLSEATRRMKQPTESSALCLPLVIGPLLGSGGEGKVYLARSSQQGQYKKFVIKKVSKDKLPGRFLNEPCPHKRQFLLREKLHHAHTIVPVDLLEDDKAIGLIMKQATGGDLHQFITRFGPLTIHAARMFFAQLMSAVGHLHSQGIVHRDIKPENILLNCRYTKCYLSDFGFMEELSNCSNYNTHNPMERRFVSVYGTTHYSAPELLHANDGLVNSEFISATDIWSCG